MVEDVFHHAQATTLFFLRGLRNLEQSLSTEIWGKSEGVLLLHYRFQNVRQTIRFISIFEKTAA